MASNSSDVVTDLSPMLKVYNDGTVERLFGSIFVPPSPEDPITGVSSKDITISSHISARLYLPNITDPCQKLPILVYFHGGGFCGESAFSSLIHSYMNILVSEAKALAVSVEYRLAPEHSLPAAYEDSWAALQWIASHHIENSSADKEPWLINHGNFDKLYIVGDSAGANIVHNLAMKAGAESLYGGVKILGAISSHPYFWGSNEQKSLPYRIWMFVYPSAPGGIDNPMVNPMAEDAPSLSGLGCSRLFVCVSEKDRLRERGLLYVEALRKSGWKSEVELVDVEGEDHVFQVHNPHSEKAKSLIKRMAAFIKN
nr:HID5 [Melodinus tenuicaudatus]